MLEIKKTDVTKICLLWLTTSCILHIEAQKINNVCPAARRETFGGVIVVKGTVDFRLSCEEGYVVPLAFKAQKYTYVCGEGKITEDLPDACITKMFALEQRGFTMRLKGTELCHDNALLKELEEKFNQSTNLHDEKKFYHGLHKGRITGCVVLPKKKESQIVFHVAYILKENQTKEGRIMEFNIAFRAFLDLKGIAHRHGLEMGQGTGENTDGFNLTMNGNYVHYHCPEHLELRYDPEPVCVGCGKGRYLDVDTRKCHPCGPGMFNDLETSTECKPCPIKYSKANNLAKDINDCFDVDLDKSQSKKNILYSLLLPSIYLILYCLIIVTATKVEFWRLKFKSGSSAGSTEGSDVYSRYVSDGSSGSLTFQARIEKAKEKFLKLQATEKSATKKETAAATADKGGHASSTVSCKV